MSAKKKQRVGERNESLGKSEMSSTSLSLSAMMARMARDTSTTDFTLVCGQLRRQVHSCVLANRSPYFEAAVKRWSQGEKEIVVESCDPEVMNLVVDYIYSIPFYSFENVFLFFSKLSTSRSQFVGQILNSDLASS